jgi:acyl-CoA hydrolase
MPYRTIASVAFVTLAAVSIISTGSALAHGWFGTGATPAEITAQHQNMFAQQAELLGVSVAEIKDAWAQGKTMRELAQEKGISDEALAEKMKAAHTARLQAGLTALVEAGVITQAQADQRSAAVTKKMSDTPRRGQAMRFGDRAMMPGFGWHK